MKQSKTKSVKVKMPAPRWSDKKQEYITLCYDHPDQREFVFTIKGRPFSMLSTQKLPVPSSSLIDYNLVRDLGLKMEELQCSKFSYGGSRFRILGKISQTVQTIKDGVVSGTAHLRAAVVENLTAIFDTHSIAGKKMTELLEKKVDTNHNTEARFGSPSSPGSPETAAAADFSSRSASSSPKGSPSTALPPSSTTPAPSSPGRCRTPTPTTSGGSSLQHSLQHVPEVHSPKPFKGHFSTTYAWPQRKEILSHEPARTLSLKPDKKHFYGRVSHIRRMKGNGSQVTMIYGKNKSCQTFNPFGVLDTDLQVGDLVLVKQYSSFEKATKDGHVDNFPILLVYNDDEESRLRAMGVSLPDGPPDLHPGGYYG